MAQVYLAKDMAGSVVALALHKVTGYCVMFLYSHCVPNPNPFSFFSVQLPSPSRPHRTLLTLCDLFIYARNLLFVLKVRQLRPKGA